jgi:ABC-type antimicrobial peptide transport system permease subunit
MAFYVPLMQEPTISSPMLDLRIAGDPRRFSSSVRRTIESMGHHIPLRIQTLEERLDAALNMDRMVATLSVSFGALALLLASIGLYGVMSYAVSRRFSEIGVRRALGAQQGDIMWMVTWEALSLVAIGIIIGVLGALAATHLISSMLFGLKPIDLPSFALAVSLMIVVALFAAYLPARKASKVDPMVALRYE